MRAEILKLLHEISIIYSDLAFLMDRENTDQETLETTLTLGVLLRRLLAVLDPAGEA